MALAEVEGGMNTCKGCRYRLDFNLQNMNMICAHPANVDFIQADVSTPTFGARSEPFRFLVVNSDFGCNLFQPRESQPCL